MKTIFMNIENNKTNESNKFVLNVSQRLDLSKHVINKHVALQNLSIYYTWKNIAKQYKNNKLKIIAPTWNDEFELPEFIIKKYNILATIPVIHVYMNRINNRLVFKIKDRYQLE